MITHQIIGDDMQAVVLTLGGGDVVRAEAGALMYMTEAVEMDAKMDGGILGGLTRRFLAGESLFITYFRGMAPDAKVAFAGPYPGKIIHIPLAGQDVLCQRDAFLCAIGDVNTPTQDNPSDAEFYYFSLDGTADYLYTSSAGVNAPGHMIGTVSNTGIIMCYFATIP